jgi:hypothetical protein
MGVCGDRDFQRSIFARLKQAARDTTDGGNVVKREGAWVVRVETSVEESLKLYLVKSNSRKAEGNSRQFCCKSSSVWSSQSKQLFPHLKRALTAPANPRKLADLCPAAPADRRPS